MMILDKNTGCWQESAQPAVLLGEYIKCAIVANVMNALSMVPVLQKA